MVLAAAYFLARGYPVLRVNQRGAGPSRRFCRRQYHAGRTEDFAALLDRLDPQLTRNGVLPIGFSLGGNMLLKYLGEIGRNGPVRRAAAVSAPLDLAHSCRSLMRWRNYLYHRYILTHLKRNCTAPGAALSETERKTILGAPSLWAFDDGFTAPRHGYAGAEDFYGANSCQHFLGGIHAPTLLIHAQDDPFVPAGPYLERPWSGEPHLTALLAQERRPSRLPRHVGGLAPAPDRGLLRRGLSATPIRPGPRDPSHSRRTSDRMLRSPVISSVSDMRSRSRLTMTA